MKITCLVDNAARLGSPFWGEHGVAFLIAVDGGQVLFDTGGSGTVLLHNMEVAGVTPESISALALSHAHSDHTGGLPALLKRQPGLPVYAHSDLLRERFSQRGDRLIARGPSLGYEALSEQADLRLSAAPQKMLPGVWTSGEISERPEPEGRSPYHVVRQGDGWVADPYRDDMALIVESAQGLVLVCGCCHAGLLNTLAHVQRIFPGRGELVAVIGGTHLAHADEAHMRRLVQVLQRLGPPALYPNHCTGQAAYVALAQAFGERVAPCPAGTVLEF